jgi:hypothetical protein
VRALSPEIAPLAAGEELIDPASFETLHGGAPRPGWRPLPLTEPETELLLEDVVEPEPTPAWMRLAVPRAPRTPRLEECRTRQEAERIAVAQARAHADAVAVFLARRGGIQALCCDPAPRRAPGLITWQGRPHALAAVLERRTPWRGALAHDPLTRRILRTLGREGVREIALLPLSIDERFVGFLYADAGHGTLEDASVTALDAVARRLGAAWTRLIRERKRGRQRAR